MSSKRVRDILSRVREFHHRLAKLYQGLSKDQQDEKGRLLLQYMGRHEAEFERCLARYEREAVEGILDSWVRFADDDSLNLVLCEVPLRADMTPEELIECALKFDDALLALYRHLADSTTAPRVQELFATLAEMEENKEHRYARSLLE